MSVRYEERLCSLVLKEELFPLMREMKEYISTLTVAGKGTACFGKPKLILRINGVFSELHHVSPFRAVGVRPSPFSHSSGTKDWKLHECSECTICDIDDVPFLKIIDSHLVYLITGRLCRECGWLPNGFSAEVGGHKSKQTWNESNALCRYGKWILLLFVYFVTVCQYFPVF